MIDRVLLLLVLEVLFLVLMMYVVLVNVLNVSKINLNNKWIKLCDILYVIDLFFIGIVVKFV